LLFPLAGILTFLELRLDMTFPVNLFIASFDRHRVMARARVKAAYAAPSLINVVKSDRLHNTCREMPLHPIPTIRSRTMAESSTTNTRFGKFTGQIAWSVDTTATLCAGE